MASFITEHIDIWTAAQTQKTNSGRGRGNGSANQSPHGIKKLRELILELAVRGKLVPQNLNDEPASVLLEKIAKEKVRLIKEGKIKKQKPLPKNTGDQKAFELPYGWEWTQLGNLSANIHYGYTASADHVNTGIRLLRITDIQNDSVNWETVPGCEIEENNANDYLLENDDILIARTGGTIGKSYLVENINIKAVFASYLIRVKRIEGMYSPFIKTYLGSQTYWQQLYENSMGTGQPNVNATALKGLVFPIPPLAEQHRIVAKVDELKALCDQLEQKQTDSNTAHQTLVETLLATLTRAANKNEFNETWERIAENFDTLFTTEHSIDKLKQTILQLAVMGKLVPQDPNDEPARELLKRIAKEKVRLIKEGKIKKQEPLPEITDSEKPFKLPYSWEWTRLGDVTNYGISDKAEHSSVDKDTWVLELEDVEKETSELLQKVRFTDRRFRSSKNRFYEGDVIYGKLRPYLDKVIIADENGVCTTEMIPLRGYSNITSQYLRLVMKSPFFISYANNSTHGMNLPRMGTDKARLALFPMVSEAEQQRIVAKVDELMALCDSLKTRLNDAQTTQAQLADTIVEQAVA